MKKYTTTYYQIAFNGTLNFKLAQQKIKKLEGEIDQAKGAMRWEQKNVSESEIRKYKSEISDKQEELDLMNSKVDQLQFEQTDQEKINEHLNEMASQGWELKSSQPILRGVFNHEIDYAVSGKDYGFSYSLTDGLMFVGERE